MATETKPNRGAEEPQELTQRKTIPDHMSIEEWRSRPGYLVALHEGDEDIPTLLKAFLATGRRRI